LLGSARCSILAYAEKIESDISIPAQGQSFILERKLGDMRFLIAITSSQNTALTKLAAE